MNVVGVIPARAASTRFPNKPMAKIAGKPMLQWVVEAAQSCSKLSKVIVATDDGPIFELAESLGAVAAMTDSELPTGTDRVNAAVLNEDCDVVVNIQGDEPLLQASHLDALLAPFFADSSVEMATLCGPLDRAELDDPNVVKVIKDAHGAGIYFSRHAIPYSRLDAPAQDLACFKHFGLYAYKKEVLKAFCAQPPVPLEKAESLEQLRALYLGKKIMVEFISEGLHGVDRPEDIKKIESIIESKRS